MRKPERQLCVMLRCSAVWWWMGVRRRASTEMVELGGVEGLAKRSPRNCYETVEMIATEGAQLRIFLQSVGGRRCRFLRDQTLPNAQCSSRHNRGIRCGSWKCSALVG
jgi:hypothetical protein